MKKVTGFVLQTRGLTFLAILLMSLFVLSTSCKDNSVSPVPAELTFEDILSRGGAFESFPDYRTTDTVAVGEPESRDYDTTDENGSSITQRFVCNRKTLSVLDGNGQFPLFNTNADVIYPGILLQGKTLTAATPSPIVVKRAGGTISYNLNNGNLVSSFYVDEVKKSTIQDGMNNIIANAGEVVPANFQLDIEEVHSETQLALEMGIDVQKMSASVSANMSFSTEHQYNRFLVKLNQQYYTMSFDLPTGLNELFDESVTPDELSRYVQDDNPATFISSVTYGRIFYMLVESTSSSKEMKGKLDISYGTFGNKVEGNVDMNAFNELENVKVKTIAYGGDAKGTFQLTGETSINNIADKLAETTDIRAGLPLSYVVRSVERPDVIVGTKLAAEYDIMECRLKGVLPPVGFSSLVDLFEDGIGATSQINGSMMILYNIAGTEYVIYDLENDQLSEKYSIHDPNGPMGATNFTAVTAAIRTAFPKLDKDQLNKFPEGENQIRIFNENGTRFELLKYSNQTEIPTGLFGEYLLNSDGTRKIENIDSYYTNLAKMKEFPFLGDGFRAAVLKDHIHTSEPLWEDRTWPLSDKRSGTEHTWTSEQVYYSSESKGSAYAVFTEEFIYKNNWYKDNVYNWKRNWADKIDLSTESEFPFTSLESACRIDLSDGARILYFSQDDEMSLYSLGAKTYRGPWVIN